MTYIIAEAGSCHDGDLKKASALVKTASKCGANAIKFQLLTDKQLFNGNKYLPWNWMPDLISIGYDEGIEVFASAFNFSGAEYLRDIGCSSIKFAYSQRELYRWYVMDFAYMYTSSGVMDPITHGQNLFCIPEYPVPYEVNFDGLFPLFKGFSDHTMGIRQAVRAVKSGAEIIEKHMAGDWWSDCPDYKFALKPVEFKEMYTQIRKVNNEK